MLKSQGNRNKDEQLGMNHSTAQNQLRKIIMFNLVKKVGLDVCFRCGKKIETVSDFSIDHKVPWIDSENPLELFFDLENISFSHLSCNVLESRGSQKYFSEEERIAAIKKSRKDSKNRFGAEARKKKRREDYLKYGH